MSFVCSKITYQTEMTKKLHGKWNNTTKHTSTSINPPKTRFLQTKARELYQKSHLHYARAKSQRKCSMFIILKTTYFWIPSNATHETALFSHIRKSFLVHDGQKRGRQSNNYYRERFTKKMTQEQNSAHSYGWFH